MRQRGESAQAFAAFVIYREQAPPRSIRKVATALGRGARVLEQWSSKHRWVERATAYTDHLDRLLLAAHEDDVVRRRREENERLFGIGRSLLELGQTSVQTIIPESMETGETVRVLEAGNKFVRLAIGLPTDLSGQMQVSLNDLQRILRDFIQLAAKRMTPEAHEALVRDCFAMVEKELGYA